MIKPLQDRVLVRQKEAEKTTQSGLIIPDNAQEKPQEGTVIAIGDGKLLDNGITVKPSVKIGDRVIYGKYGGTEIVVEGETMLLMRESDIYCIVT